jgi:hypothetical protein
MNDNEKDCIRNAPGWSRELPAFLAEHFGYNPFHYVALIREIILFKIVPYSTYRHAIRMGQHHWI